MTTWVYKNGVLISDSLVTQNGYRVGTMKKSIKTRDGWLAAGAGQCSDIASFLEWAEHRDPDLALKLSNLDGVLINPKGEVFAVEDELRPYKIEAEFYTGGSGGIIAMGVLANGGSIEDAMEVAFKIDTGTGGDWQVHKLGKVNEKN